MLQLEPEQGMEKLQWERKLQQQGNEAKSKGRRIEKNSCI